MKKLLLFLSLFNPIFPSPLHKKEAKMHDVLHEKYPYVVVVYGLEDPEGEKFPWEQDSHFKAALTASALTCSVGIAVALAIAYKLSN